MKLKGICPDCGKVVNMADSHFRQTCEHCGGRFLVKWGRMEYHARWAAAVVVISLILAMLIYELTH